MDPTTLGLTVAVLGLLCYYLLFHRKLGHFEEVGVPHLKPLPFFGNMAPAVFRRVAMVEHLQNCYNRFPGAKYFGFYEYTCPVTVIRDPELIASIAVKNFDNFIDHRGMADPDIDLLGGKNLFSLRGDQWREMRKLLSPAFTASKMRQMHVLIEECAESFKSYILEETKTGGRVMDVKEILCRFTNDIVATCAFGIKVDSMKDPNNDFFTLGREATNFDGNLTFKFLLGPHFKTLSRLFGWKMFSDKVTNYFIHLVENTIRARDEAAIVRPDMIQLMMDSRGKGPGPDLTIEEMTSQAFVFFFGGFDSTATFLSFLFHLVGTNPSVQERLRSEIETTIAESKGASSSSQSNYEAINGMKYLDAVVSEGLRLYPLATFLDRVCVKELQLPAPTPGARPVTIKPGQLVWFPPYALHRDPKYYPEPDRFDPERFLRGEVNQACYMPFGMGPRMCIANRFALLVMKTLLFHLLPSCTLEPCSKTTLPMVLSKKIFLMMPENGFWLKFRTRDNASSIPSRHATNGKIDNGSAPVK